MANSKIYLKSEAGGTTTLSRDTTANSGNLVLPASGNVTSVDTAVTDNAIARFDGVTGKVQNSGVIIDDSGNLTIESSTASVELNIDSTQNSNVNFIEGGVTKWNVGYVPSLSAFRFSNTTNDILNITDSGNIGIGVSTNLTGLLNFPMSDSGEVINIYSSSNEASRSGIGKYATEFRSYVATTDFFSWYYGGPSGTSAMTLNSTGLDVVTDIKLNGTSVTAVGNNANGNYTKFADGTLICQRFYSSGTVESGGGAIPWTYPHAFISNPSASNIGAFPYGDYYNYSCQTATTTSVIAYYRPIPNTSAASGVGHSLDLHQLAIGRWK